GRRHQMIAWMPQDMAQDSEHAYKKLVQITEKAIEDAFLELGVDSREGSHKAISRVHLLKHFDRDDWGCESDESSEHGCFLHAAFIKKPKSNHPTPEYMGQGKSYFFKGDYFYRNEITITGGPASNPDTMLLYTTISKH